MTSLRSVLLVLGLYGASGLVLGAPALRPAIIAAARAAAASPLALPARPVVAALAVGRAGAPTMGLFGLGAPELAIIAAVALLVLGPEQVKKLAKDVGKVSAELKQVPEEFSKGLEIGKQELEKKAPPVRRAQLGAARERASARARNALCVPPWAREQPLTAPLAALQAAPPAEKKD